jgi:hypothetical protein
MRFSFPIEAENDVAIFVVYACVYLVEVIAGCVFPRGTAKWGLLIHNYIPENYFVPCMGALIKFETAQIC